ncbi:daunorubicin resistance protein DrrA family ABC transporter ATP-binding protein [Lentzea aerocolonigenes]|uniref:daunorubicin resistance protein DrrA family ABC transporter ATP-binding protein n=1 Tax=Lentzea aerocolonigenes TaxID=68170 RepID=UPI0004C2E218|nr:daunorubicin resistance protein DrrA family ABC transporter ATP-binding protein [Lentzea aerocolonigenes]MCP2247624.1 ABC-2 type transport system ATP-binding protein [Lentzea aerocolonigenes]
MIVETTGLTKSYGTNTVLTGLDLEVAEGSVLALLGPNGAGKTTTIRILSTLTRPDGGTARIAGFDVVREAAKVREVISLTGQYAAVDEEQTGRENLVMIARLRRFSRSAARSRSADLLERFDLVDAADRRVRTYSGGMRRRLDLAMSLVARPRLLFLDEPTTGLDPVSRTTMWDAIGELVREGVTIFLTTQYLEEADRLADRIVVLHRGGVVADGTADALKNQVGGTRLDLDFGTALDAGRAEVLVGGVRTGSRLSTPSDGSAAHLHRVLDDLRVAGVHPERVSTHRPTLDDVFVAVAA